MTDLENAPVRLQDRVQQALKGTCAIERERWRLHPAFKELTTPQG